MRCCKASCCSRLFLISARHLNDFAFYRVFIERVEVGRFGNSKFEEKKNRHLTAQINFQKTSNANQAVHGLRVEVESGR